MTFELVVDEKDMIANDWTFKRFLHYKQDDDTRLTKWNFFGIKNPKEVLTENQKPVLEEIGPFAAVLDTVKYDVAFTQDDFQKLFYCGSENLCAPPCQLAGRHLGLTNSKFWSETTGEKHIG